MWPTAALHQPRLHSVEPLLWLVLSACREHQASRSLSTPTRPCSSVSVRVAAAFGPAAGSAACQVRPGNSRAACIKTRAAAMPLAAPLALGRRLQEHRVARTAAAFAASHCGCIWLHRLLESRCHSTAHSTRQLRRCQDRLARALAAAAAARWVPRRRCEGSSAEHIGTERRLDADATISVDVGAHSGDDWACG